METWDAIRSRRNVREFSDQPIEPKHLDRILDAGRRTPSARNRQPWDFVLVADRDRQAQLAKVWQGARHVEGAPAVVGLVAPRVETDRERNLLYFDLGQAVMMMMLAAADLGIGTGHASVADQELSRKILGFPADRFLAHMLAVGYPSGAPLRPIQTMNRRMFGEVVHRQEW